MPALVACASVRMVVSLAVNPSRSLYSAAMSLASLTQPLRVNWGYLANWLIPTSSAFFPAICCLLLLCWFVVMLLLIEICFAAPVPWTVRPEIGVGEREECEGKQKRIEMRKRVHSSIFWGNPPCSKAAAI